MKNRVRAPALTFALLSNIYWIGVQGFWMVLTTAYGLQFPSKLPYYATWLLSAGPPVIYALACVTFCHWFARRMVRDVLKGTG